MKAIIIKTILLTFLTISSIILSAQVTNTKLNPGDKLPRTIFPVKNYAAPTINLDDFKDKLILIDIWDVTCSGCIMAMPKLEKLQEQFKDQIKVILLSNDSWEAIEKLKKRSEILQEVKLPMIIGDANLESKINYTYLPTYIWVKNGTHILNITDSKALTEANIRSFLQNGLISAENKRELNTKGKGPLLTQIYPVIGDTYEFSAFLWKETHTVLAGHSILRDYGNPVRLVKKLNAGGANVRGLYKLAHSDKFQNRSYKRIVFDDPLLYKALDTINYSFEMIFQRMTPEQKALDLACNILDINLGLTSRVDTLVQDVFVLKRMKGAPLKLLTEPKKNIENAGTLDNQDFLGIKDGMWAMAITNFTGDSGQIIPQYEIIDETGIDIETKVTFEMPQDLSLKNLKNVNKKLATFGLELEFTKRPLEVVVISKP